MNDLRRSTTIGDVPISAPSVDEEPLARKRMGRLLYPASDATVIDEADSHEASRRVADEAPQVVFPDVKMPGGSA